MTIESMKGTRNPQVGRRHLRFAHGIVAGRCIMAAIIVTVSFGQLAAQDRETKVRNDRQAVEANAFWIYNDLPGAIARATETNKPLLVVFRCIPCEACAQLDADIVERDPAVRQLLDKFVCVRIVHANGMDLSLFQFDYDQSFAAFFMNADKTIYGRFGTRSHQTESDQDVSLEGFVKALGGALELHGKYPANRTALLAKRGSKSEVSVPEEFPSLQGKFGSKLNYEGNVVQSCIHCHQVGEALRLVHRTAAKPIPDHVLYPYPNPKILGLVMDPKEKAKVAEVVEGSSAERDGYKPGDELLTLEGQPLLSIADVQWLLHNAGPSAKLEAEVLRGGSTLRLPLTLRDGWRQRGDISWRATSWDLRRIATGGLVLEDMTNSQRRDERLDQDSLALRIRHVGQYGDHAVGKRAGFRKDDIVVEVDGRSGRMTESELLAYVLNRKQAGDSVPMAVLRNGRKVSLELPIQ